MTAEQWAEYEVVYQTRIGMLCAAGEPTNEQVEMAKAEANESVKDWPNPPVPPEIC